MPVFSPLFAGFQLLHANIPSPNFSLCRKRSVLTWGSFFEPGQFDLQSTKNTDAKSGGMMFTGE